MENGLMKIKHPVNALTVVVCVIQLVAFSCSGPKQTSEKKSEAKQPQSDNSESVQQSDDPEVKAASDEDFYLGDALDSSDDADSTSESAGVITVKPTEAPVVQSVEKTKAPDAPCVAHANKHAEKYGLNSMERFDADESDSLSLNEFLLPFSKNIEPAKKASFEANRTALFKKFSGADEQLSLTELQDSIKDRMSQRCIKRASDDNGTHGEAVKKHREASFKKMDSNQDGNISREEAQAFLKSRESH
jgi:Ca2+-binding EF-hand superfamily protein